MAASGGFSFGNTNPLGSTQPSLGSTGGFSFGGAATATTKAATGGFGFGTATSAAPTGLGGFGTTTTGFGATGLGLAKTTASTLTLGAPAASTAAAGFSFGTPAASTSAFTGLATGIGAKATTATTTLTLGAPASTATTGFGFGTAVKPSTTTGLGGTLGGGTLSLGGGLGGTSAASTSLITGFTATPASKAASVGLGGVDPKATGSAAGSGNGTNGKPSDNKAVKDCALPQPICNTVAEFKKFVKNEKSVRENIARMSCKPLYKVQEEVASLKQLLSLVSTGLQRNASAIDKLKREAMQELKFAEMSQRTKDTPPGLQYENVAPTEYFHMLAERFESQMVTYRQQIEEMEGHLSTMQLGDTLSPQELANLLNKLHEGFVVLAAQLQAVHEAVKAQKEQYLNYRKVFLGDSTNIFEKRRKVEEKTGSKVSIGPSPFTGMSNATALAMATALARAQQPPGPAAASVAAGSGIFGGVPQPAAAAPMGTGTLFGYGATAAAGTGTGIFGGAATQTGGLFGAKPTGFGTGLGTTTTQSTGFSFSTPTAAVRPLGTGFGTTNPATAGFGGFGTAQQQPQQPATGGFSFGQTNTAFQLQNPPAGNKRGKKS